MKDISMFLRVLGKSFRRRISRIVVALLAVIVGAATTAVLISVSVDIHRKLSVEFRAYGANLMILPKTDTLSIQTGGIEFETMNEAAYLDETALNAIDAIPSAQRVVGYAPYLYSLVDVDNQLVALVGTWFDAVKKISPWWQDEGLWPSDRNDMTSCLMGVTAAEKLKLKLGDSFIVRYGEGAEETKYKLTVTGIVMTGASEDNQLFVNLPVVQKLIGYSGKINLALVSVLGNGSQIVQVAHEIQSVSPGVEAKPIRQISESEGIVLNKLRLMMFLMTGVILLAAGLCVMTTMTSLMLERRKEIGIMKAIGAEDNHIATLFLGEIGILGFVGGLIGYAIGFGLAQWIGQRVFNSPISLRLPVIPIVIGISLVVCLIASLLPIKSAIQTQPAIVLRGE